MALDLGQWPDGKVVGEKRLRLVGLQRIRNRLVWARVNSN